MSDLATAQWTALGSTAAVVVTEALALPSARAAVETVLAAIDIACSRFRTDSELARLVTARGDWVAVSPLLAEAIAVALRAAVLTDGAVDPTVGEALVLAGYDRDFGEGLRSSGTVPVVHTVPGWRVIATDAAGRIRIPRGVRLDLGATAKALAADRAARAAAHSAGGAGVLVNLGGDIAVAGPPPGGGWAVRVADDHRAGRNAPGQSVTMQAGGLATSSTTVRRWADGAHHLIDPATGRPARSPWRTVSVAAATCVDANIASTAAIVRGEDALAWLSERRLPARLVAHDGSVVAIGDWPAEVLAA